MDGPRRQSIYNFIVQNFSTDAFDNARDHDYDRTFERTFPSYHAFQTYQRQIVNGLDAGTLAFAEYVKAFIEARILEVHDSDSGSRFNPSGFYYLNGKMVLEGFP